jgi:hypothetical protein
LGIADRGRHLMAGWIPTPADRWLEHRLAIPCEWPETLVVLDLRFWDDPIACGNRKRPSVRKLAELWGWNRGAATRLIKNRAAWADQRRATAVPEPYQSRTTTEPLPSHGHTTAVPVDAGDTPTIRPTHTSAIPAPYHEHTSAVPLPSHERTSAVPAPIETHARSPTPTQAPPPAPAPAPTPAQPSLLGTGVARSATAVPGKPAGLPAQQRLSGKRQAALRIFDRWHAHHPRAGEVPDDSQRDRIVECLERRAKVIRGKRKTYESSDWIAAERDLVDLVAWFHTASGAAHWQGHNDRGKKYLGVSVIFNPKKLGDRVDDLIEWRDSGRRTDAPPAQARSTGKGAYALDFDSLRTPERDWIDVEVIDSTPAKGGHHAQ